MSNLRQTLFPFALVNLKQGTKKHSIKWNSLNHSCIIINVDGTCNATSIHNGFRGTYHTSIRHDSVAPLDSSQTLMIYSTKNFRSFTKASHYPNAWTLLTHHATQTHPLIRIGLIEALENVSTLSVVGLI